MATINTPTEDHREQAKQEAGAMLPDIDPTIAEIVLSAFLANPTHKVGEVVTALALGAPSPEVAAETVTACFELLLCSEKGKLYWVEREARDILVGIRSIPHTHGIRVGTEAHWPMIALIVGPPKSAIIRMPDGARRVWMACEDMDGAVVRQSEAIALGNAMVEAFGGRIIEDRSGPETMAKSFIEDNMTARAKRRAAALDQAETMTVKQRSKGARAGHHRVAMIEALPGACEVGMVLCPEDRPETLYEVQTRVNEDWVVLVAQEPGEKGGVPEPGAWVQPNGGSGPVGAEGPPHWGFTEEATASYETDTPTTTTDEGSGEE